jgi:hypothetical protein
VGDYEQPRLGPLPHRDPDPDPEWTEYVAWLDGEIAAGHEREAGLCAPEDPQAWGRADPPFPGREAALPAPRFEAVSPAPGPPAAPPAPDSEAAPPAPGREAALPARSRFGQGDEADVLPPCQLLVGLTEGAVRDLDRLSDNELIGVLQAARRQVAREQYKQVLVTAEFGRRRQAAFEDAARRGLPVGCRPGGFPGEELASELVATRAEAGHRIDDALDLTTRLPLTLAGMAAGQIDEERAGWIALYTRSLDAADTARADQILADAAPDLRVDQLARKAAALEKKFAPEAVKARKERAKRDDQRVEARRELSGNASLSGREMDTADVLAAKAHIDAVAARLRAGGLAGPIGALRVLALADLTQGRNPLDRLAGPRTASPRPTPASPTPASPAPATPAEPVPLPAEINLIVPVGTLLGSSTDPAQAGAWGMLDRDETRTVVGAASRHPRTRWCVTLTGPDGTALAHGCARGQHPGLLNDLAAQPPPTRPAELLRRLNLTFIQVAQGACDHTQSEDHYIPSRKLKHLIRARSASCDAPGCPAHASYADLDHTTPWPGGPTDQCNLAPRCRTHHRAKQAPNWKVEQPEPGVTRWTLPSGRSHVTTATVYDS